jgi:hypothetical protein
VGTSCTWCVIAAMTSRAALAMGALHHASFACAALKQDSGHVKSSSCNLLVPRHQENLFCNGVHQPSMETNTMDVNMFGDYPVPHLAYARSLPGTICD